MTSEFKPSPPEWIQLLPDPLPPDPQEVSYVDVTNMGRHPSYRYKLEEARRVRRIVGQVLGVYDPLRDINDKRIGYLFCDRFGIDHPRVYADYSSLEEIVWDELPDEFVLKSRFGSSNRGVKALIRQSGIEYFDLLRGRVWTVEEMREAQDELEEKRLASRAMFAEELILKKNAPPEVADDWKFYCFDGRVAISMQRDLRGSPDPKDWRFAFRDRDWNNLGFVKFVDRVDPDLPLPSDPDALVEVAERLSRIIGHAFLRIDLLESERGPLLGEFTPLPGPPEIFTPEIDSLLGEFWEQADARVYARFIESGAWDHLLFGRTELELYPPIVPVDEGAEPTVDSVDGLKHELREVRAALSEARKQLLGYIDSARRLREALERSNEDKAKVSAELVELRERVFRLSDELETEKREVGALRKQLRDVSARLEGEAHLKGELDRARHRAVRLETERDRLRHRVEVLDWKLFAMRQRRWWRLGELLGGIRARPLGVFRFPLDFMRLLRQPATPVPRPHPANDRPDGT